MHKIMKCPKCGTEHLIIKTCYNCGDCKHNGIWNEESQEYIYKEELENGEERTQVYDNFSCELEDCLFGGEGCTIVECPNCGKIIELIPFNNC